MRRAFGKPLANARTTERVFVKQEAEGSGIRVPRCDVRAYAQKHFERNLGDHIRSFTEVLTVTDARLGKEFIDQANADVVTAVRRPSGAAAVIKHRQSQCRTPSFRVVDLPRRRLRNP